MQRLWELQSLMIKITTFMRIKRTSKSLQRAKIWMNNQIPWKKCACSSKSKVSTSSKSKKSLKRLQPSERKERSVSQNVYLGLINQVGLVTYELTLNQMHRFLSNRFLKSTSVVKKTLILELRNVILRCLRVPLLARLWTQGLTPQEMSGPVYQTATK